MIMCITIYVSTLYAAPPPIYDEVKEKRAQTVAQQPPQQPAQQPLPSGQVFYSAQQPQVVPGTVYQMPYQIPQMYQQVNVCDKVLLDMQLKIIIT